MDLKELLGEELFNQLSAKLGDKKLILDDGLMIPKHRFDELSSQNKSLKEQIDGYDKQLKDLKKDAEGNKDLIEKIENLQKSNKEQKENFDKELLKIQKKSALKEALSLEGAKYPDLLADKFDLEKIELDGDKVKNVSDVIKPYKEQYADLFGKTVKKGFDPNKDVKNPNPTGTYTREQVQAMSQTEVNANLAEIQKSMETWQ